MELAQLLKPSCCIVGMRYADKAACLGDLAKKAAGILELDRVSILSGLCHRESLGSTGLGLGIALPHARLAGIARPFIMLSLLREPVAFDAIDGRPVDIVCLVLLPLDPEPTNALALVARRLRDKEALRAIRASHSVETLHAAMTGT